VSRFSWIGLVLNTVGLLTMALPFVVPVGTSEGEFSIDDGELTVLGCFVGPEIVIAFGAVVVGTTALVIGSRRRVRRS